MSTMAPINATFQSSPVRASDTKLDATTMGFHHSQSPSNPIATATKPAAGNTHKAPKYTNSAVTQVPTATEQCGLIAQALDFRDFQVHGRAHQVD